MLLEDAAPTQDLLLRLISPPFSYFFPREKTSFDLLILSCAFFHLPSLFFTSFKGKVMRDQVFHSLKIRGSLMELIFSPVFLTIDRRLLRGSPITQKVKVVTKSHLYYSYSPNNAQIFF